MLALFTCVVSYGDHNFCGARIPIPTNLNLPQWAELCYTDDDFRTFSFLTYGFPAGYTSPIPTPSKNESPFGHKPQPPCGSLRLQRAGGGGHAGSI